MNQVYVRELTQGSAAKPYETVVADIDGLIRLSCNCMGWAIWKDHNDARWCKHTKKLIAKYGLTVKQGGGKDDKEFQIVTGALNHTHLAQLLGTGVTGVVTPKTPAPKTSPKTPKTPAPTPKTSPKTSPKQPAKSAPAPVAPIQSYDGFNIIYVPETPAIDPYVAPMLAEKMPNLLDEKVETVLAEIAKRYSDGTWAMEEKYDGERVTLARMNGALTMWSRPQRDKDALKRPVPAHIAQVFAALPEAVSFTLDGEIYIPGGISTDVKALDNAGKHVLVVFDIVRLLGEDTTGNTYDERRAYLEELFSRDQFEGQTAVVLAASFAPSVEFVREVWARGGEGAILKRRAAKYQPGVRSRDIIKVKGLEHHIMELVGFKAGKLGPYSVWQFRNPKDNSTADVKWKSLKTLDAVEKNGAEWLKGNRRAVIECQLRTRDGNYRHPRFDRWENE